MSGFNAPSIRRCFLIPKEVMHDSLRFHLLLVYFRQRLAPLAKEGSSRASLRDPISERSEQDKQWGRVSLAQNLSTGGKIAFGNIS